MVVMHYVQAILLISVVNAHTSCPKDNDLPGLPVPPEECVLPWTDFQKYAANRSYVAAYKIDTTGRLSDSAVKIRIDVLPDGRISVKSGTWELRKYFENSYDLNESLFTSLKDESVFYRCPDRLRLPLIFYYAHTAVVYDRLNFEFEKMFETGVDEMSWDDTENNRMGGLYKWPEVGATVEYRRQVRAAVLRIIDDTPLKLPITMASPWWALLMGMEHERIHLETSSVLIRQLPVAMVTKPKEWTYAPKTTGIVPQQNRMLRVPAQEVSFGKPRDYPAYGWDNEYGSFACS
ncbi:hypothetical protein MAR_005522 [Mya arenaria]|uniref:DinB-like domain-containing protein n=1 Tax=Mya arenaria TaxID=6604 RepID=A0ABY7F2X8_MYAAR|nr:hypothetical protein MAR_005522 [Mya arenaria]